MAFPHGYVSIVRGKLILQLRGCGRFIINKFTDNDSIGKTFSWFRYDSMPKLLEDYELTDNIKTSALLTMYTEYKKNGYLKGVLDFFIKYFARSGNYDTANERFEYAFKHYLKEMNSEQLINVRLRAHVWVGNSLCLP